MAQLRAGERALLVVPPGRVSGYSAPTRHPHRKRPDHYRWQVLVDDAISSPLETYRVRVAPSWIDYNGHMNEGYYAVAFGDASDAYMIGAGFDEDYRATSRGTFYTVETHIRYLQELKLDDPLLFRTTILGVDERKLHLFHSMEHAEQGYEAATQEAFFLHVSLDEVTTTPMAPWLLNTMQRDRDSHRQLQPHGAGQAIRSIGHQA